MQTFPPGAKTPLLIALAGLFAASQLALGQTAIPPSTATSPGETENEAVKLSPFEVRTTKDEGYVASNTLAGTRMNTELWDTPIAVSIFTPEFLEDTGVLDVK
jgi:iron complex outermembrane receptor protein